MISKLAGGVSALLFFPQLRVTSASAFYIMAKTIVVLSPRSRFIIGLTLRGVLFRILAVII